MLLLSIKNRTGLFNRTKSKQEEEVTFWRKELDQYLKWYRGELDNMYGVKSPSVEQKVATQSEKDSAILTWFNLHQKPKYLQDLGIEKTSLQGMKVLDVGAGPMPSGLVFEGVDLYCLDQLYPEYLKAGYPIHYYGNVKFISGSSENIPVANDFFDAVISVNAIDHVDNLHTTAQEIRRVLRPLGNFAMHVHYHIPTPTEPLEITDEVFKREFEWCNGLQKKKESRRKKGSVAAPNEKYVVWRNL